MVCDEKQRLLKAYQEVAQKYAAAVTELEANTGTLPKADYDSLYRATETLHAEVTRAQGEFNSHVLAHGC